MPIKSKMTSKSLKMIEKITGTQLSLGKLLRAIREADEVLQTEFAEKLGMNKQQLCDIENDRKSVSPKLAAIYAEKLGYSKEQFIRLSLQAIVDREGLNMTVEVSPKSSKKIHSLKWARA